MKSTGLSFNTRKCLEVHLGQQAASEVYEMLAQLRAEVDMLRRNKVDITQIVPIGDDAEFESHLDSMLDPLRPQL